MTLRDWKGRVDTDSDGDSRRWHQIVQPISNNDAPGIAILGFACDEGVRRNGGRVGAAEGPRVLREMLSNLPALDQTPLYEAGEIQCAEGDLEGAQAQFASHVSALLDAGHFVVGLGGGHEIAYASFLGLMGHLRASRPRLAIVNFDAHFDLRDQPEASSGTPFLQALRYADGAGMTMDYICIGVSSSANTSSMFAKAESSGTHYYRDDQLGALEAQDRAREISSLLERTDFVYLTICLDVLPPGVSPGVSAPSARGVDQGVVECLIDTVMATGKVRLCDIAELSPPYDNAGTTARVGARLIHRIANRACGGLTQY